MRLYYDVGFDIEFIGEFDTLKDAESEIVRFWSEHGHKIPYIRESNHSEYYLLDVGFHTRFYKLYKEEQK